MSSTQVQNVLNAIRANHGIVIDDNSPVGSQYKIKHIAVQKSEEFGENILPVFNHDRFPMNPIYLDDSGRPHISIVQVGKVMDTRNIEVFDIPSMDEEVSLVVEV